MIWVEKWRFRAVERECQTWNHQAVRGVVLLQQGPCPNLKANLNLNNFGVPTLHSENITDLCRVSLGLDVLL